MKKRWKISFTLKHSSTPSDRVGLLVELLRGAGVINRVESMNQTETIVTLFQPHAVDNGEQWATSNCDRIRSFGPEFQPEAFSA